MQAALSAAGAGTGVRGSLGARRRGEVQADDDRGLQVYTLSVYQGAPIMKASFVDLRRKSAAIIRALQRKEPVTVLYRGVPAAIMQPVGQPTAKPIGSVKNHAAFGMWADREDIQDVASHVRRIRRGRYDAL